MKMRFLLFFLFLFSGNSLIHASIGITQIVASAADDCTGSLRIEASGTAGPFSVRIANGDGIGNDLVYPIEGGEILLEELCARLYRVSVFPTRFPSCTTTLKGNLATGVIVINGYTGGKNLLSSTVSTPAATIGLYPNPSSGQVRLSWLNAPEALMVVPAQAVKVYDELGRIVLELDGPFFTTAQSGNLIAKFNLKDQPSGVYVVQLLVGDQLLTEKLLLQRRR